MNLLKDKLLESAEIGRELSADLTAIVRNEMPPDAPAIFAKIARIRYCNDDGNLWYADDLVNKETGELYAGSGRFWKCNSRLCPHCSKLSARKHRATIRKNLKQPLLIGQYRKFVTFTIPNLGLDLHQSRELVNHAWSLLRKRTWFKKTIIGGCKSEEFTVTAKGIHYHLHSILISKYIQYDKLRNLWTESFITAAAAMNIPFSIGTADSMLIVNVRNISSADQAANEVCKYITKQDSWMKLDPASVLDILRLKRFPRVFEFLGSWRDSSDADAKPRPVEREDTEENKTILDTENLSDEPIVELARIVTFADAIDYLVALETAIADQHRFRKKQLRYIQPHASFRALHTRSIARAILQRDAFELEQHHHAEITRLNAVCQRSERFGVA